MRKLFFPFACVLVSLVSGFTAHGQAQKIGFANVDYIFAEMPESKQIESNLQATQTQLQKEIEVKANEFRQKLDDYNKNAQNMLPAVRNNTERELQQLQQNLQQLKEDAQITIAQKQEELMAPVYTKVGKAIEDVAKENGFSLILTSQVGGGIDIILFGDEKLDASDLVLKKMGVTPKAKPAAPQN